MKNVKKISRREFTREAALATLSGVVITITACGDSGPSSPTPAPSSSTPTNVSAVVGSNHGHVATITAAQISAPSNIRLDITGTSNHPHTVDLTASEVEQVGRGVRVAKTSSNDDAHAHSVTFN